MTRPILLNWKLSYPLLRLQIPHQVYPQSLNPAIRHLPTDWPLRFVERDSFSMHMPLPPRMG